MNLSKLVSIAVLFLLTTACFLRNASGPDTTLAKCNEPEKNPPAVVRIPVSDEGKVPPEFETLCIQKGQAFEWYLTPQAGVAKKLMLDFPKVKPDRFVFTRPIGPRNDLEHHVRRTGKKIPYEEHEYKILVWINGQRRDVDPILIIRE